MTTTIMNPSKALSILSSMYLCRPTKENLETWKLLLSEDDSGFMHDLRAALSGVETSSKQEIEDLLWEYTRLFIGPYRLPCPPWESVYTSPKRLMMQDAYDKVKAIYNEAGLAIDNPDIMPDHIGAEFNFMVVLFQKMENEPEKKPCYEDIAKRFLDEHIMKWIPQFTMDMENAVDSQFYKSLAQATRSLIFEINNKFT